MNRIHFFATIAASVLLSYGCKSDDGDDSATTVTGADTGTEEHGASEHGAEEHGAETGTEEHGAEEHGSGGHDHSVDTDQDDPVVAYCSCVFANCHEPYHAKWGEDEMAAEQACIMEAEALPSNGAPTEMGNFIECRQHFCDAAATDPTVCTNALGDAVCL